MKTRIENSLNCAELKQDSPFTRFNYDKKAQQINDNKDAKNNQNTVNGKFYVLLERIKRALVDGCRHIKGFRDTNARSYLRDFRAKYNTFVFFTLFFYDSFSLIISPCPEFTDLSSRILKRTASAGIN